MIVVCAVVWKVLKINEAMKRERDLIEGMYYVVFLDIPTPGNNLFIFFNIANMIQQQKDYDMVLSRVSKEIKKTHNIV